MDTTPPDGGQAADSLDPFGWMDWLLDGPFKGVSDQLNLTGSPAGDDGDYFALPERCLLYTSPSPRDATLSRMPSSA